MYGLSLTLWNLLPSTHTKLGSGSAYTVPLALLTLSPSVPPKEGIFIVNEPALKVVPSSGNGAV
ncbi:hypothetical protein BC938DRAFT_470997 [Jimgerdemannia flammicorona]|uniref:Uncharacterized protein n=1 Tax=Jimgerdemannia flammicorona TaxID=994334 RepID=A0A433Q907_9FUNG|nr:hypothetical protein BC938DRAFT_470997 [Jimgerdemannia flammicorona]